jgi:hypothetical protein
MLITEEKYVRLLDSSGNPILTENGALNINATGSVTVSGQTFINSRLLTDVSGIVTIRDPIITYPTSSITTLWSGAFGDTSASATHDGTYHDKYNIFGSVDAACTLTVEFSDTSATWYSTHHVIMVGDDGIIDGTFDDIVVPYIRLKNTSTTDVNGTVLVCGKGS